MVFHCACVSIAVKLNITACPDGFIYNSDEMTCDCPSISNNSQYLICAQIQGSLCIKKGYWYGEHPDNSSKAFVIKCLTSYCSNSDLGTCPLEVTKDDKLSGYLYLSGAQNNTHTARKTRSEKFEECKGKCGCTSV